MDRGLQPNVTQFAQEHLVREQALKSGQVTRHLEGKSSSVLQGLYFAGKSREIKWPVGA